CSNAPACPRKRSATARDCSRNCEVGMLTAVLALFLPGSPATPLVDAVKAGDKAAAIVLLERRVDVNAPEADGTTALHWAVHQNDLDLVERLIRAAAKPNAKNDYAATPMSEAAIGANVEMIEKLLQAGADVESP